MATTAIELMALSGVQDSQTEHENLSLFVSVSNEQQGQNLRLLVKNYCSHQPSDTMLFMKGILTAMWANIKDIGKKKYLAVMPY